jgi:hypothetical protein
MGEWSNGNRKPGPNSAGGPRAHASRSVRATDQRRNEDSETRPFIVLKCISVSRRARRALYSRCGVDRSLDCCRLTTHTGRCVDTSKKERRNAAVGSFFGAVDQSGADRARIAEED